MAGAQTRFYTALAVVAAAGVALIGYVALRDDATTGRTVSQVPELADPGAPVPADVGVERGSADAPVTLEEYADYQCSYCGMVARLTMPGIVERYVETGKVRYIFFDFPVHPGENSYLAAEAARCAGDQGAYWSMHDVLFARMGEWTRERDPTDRFGEYAEQLGLDGGQLHECVESRQYRNLVVTNRRRGEQMGVNSTPTFIIDGQRRVPGAIGFDKLAGLLEEELAAE